MWWLAAAQAAPMIANMLMPQPSAPTYNMAASAQNPNETAYQNQMLSSAFDPQAKTYQMAADVATNQTQDALAKMGMSRSSAGAKAIQDTNATVARSWQQDAARRQTEALGSLNQSTALQNQLNMFNAGVQNQGINNAYMQQLMNRQNMIGGIGSMGQSAAMMYGMNGGGGGAPGGSPYMPMVSPDSGYTPNLDSSGGAWTNPNLSTSLGSYNYGGY
jgi:hypothetical protein